MPTKEHDVARLARRVFAGRGVGTTLRENAEDVAAPVPLRVDHRRIDAMDRDIDIGSFDRMFSMVRGSPGGHSSVRRRRYARRENVRERGDAIVHVRKP